jgi:hypothetical protein
MQIVDSLIDIRETGRMSPPHRQIPAFTEELSLTPVRDKELVMGDAICDRRGWNRPA